MKKALVIANLAVAALAVGTLGFAAVENAPRATLMSAADYQAALKAIDDESSISSMVCKRLKDYEMAVCGAELAAEKKVRMAELEARYLGTYQSRLSVRLTRIDAQFDVDKVRCEAFTGQERERCIVIAADMRHALSAEAGSRI